MKCSIEIKTTYTIITPESSILDKELVDALLDKIEDCKKSTLGLYVIVNLQQCEAMEHSAFESLLQLHTTLYAQDGSIVFTGMNEPVLQKMKQERLHLSINLTPTMEEAVDIISMEIMERDLLNEL